MLNCIKIFIIIVCCLSCISCVSPLRYDGPYEGRIIDYDTNQPIDGVVVDAVWYKRYTTLADSSSEYFDTRETVTDKNGNFSISGQGLLIFSCIDYPSITMFKAGYDGDNGPWVAYNKRNSKWINGRVTRQDGQLVVRLTGC